VICTQNKPNGTAQVDWETIPLISGTYSRDSRLGLSGRDEHQRSLNLHREKAFGGSGRISTHWSASTGEARRVGSHPLRSLIIEESRAGRPGGNETRKISLPRPRHE
jgi:hypothetical protein